MPCYLTGEHKLSEQTIHTSPKWSRNSAPNKYTWSLLCTCPFRGSCPTSHQWRLTKEHTVSESSLTVMYKGPMNCDPFSEKRGYMVGSLRNEEMWTVQRFHMEGTRCIKHTPYATTLTTICTWSPMLIKRFTKYSFSSLI